MVTNPIANQALAPGKPYRIPVDDWLAGEYLLFQLHHEGVHNALLTLAFYAREETEARLNVMYSFLQAIEAWFCFPLQRLDGQTLFLPRLPGQLKTTCLGQRISPGEIAFATLELADTNYSQRCRISHPFLGNTPPEEKLRSRPIIDTMGQLSDRSWPGKTASLHEMALALHTELESDEPAVPRDWSVRGGWRERRFAPTGYFKTEHDGDRWWLADPDGYAFFSAGIDCVRYPDDTAIVPGTEPLFDKELVANDDLRSRFYRAKAAWNMPAFSIGQANLYRALGNEWKPAWREITRRRLVRWRFNTLGCWSDQAFMQIARIPYVVFMRNYPATSRRLFRDLPDVYDPAFETAARSWAEQARSGVQDPFLIGYFMTNEPKWAFGAYNLASEILEEEEGSFTRQALAEFIAGRYEGDSEKWRSAWNMSHIEFDDLVGRPLHRLADQNEIVASDLWDFSKQIVRRFVRLPAEALRAEDPHHLNLGVRFAWIASDLLYEAGEYIDIFSLNCYRERPDTQAAEEIDRRCGRPSLIGEYHFGALDRGLPGNGLCGVVDQLERGKAYRAYFDACASHPSFVGCHWFLYNDQPALGRFDGENWQIGFVDVCCKPYDELCLAALRSHENMYGVRTGSVEPYSAAVRTAARVAC